MGAFIADTQEMIEVCLNCRRVTCTGNCTDIQMAGSAMAEAEVCGELYTWRGLTLTLGEWVRRYEIDRTTLWWRVKRKGWRLERALHTPVRGKRRKYTLTADGAPVSVAELAARCDVSIGTIEYRVKQGWTGDRILAHYGGQDG